MYLLHECLRSGRRSQRIYARKRDGVKCSWEAYCIGDESENLITWLFVLINIYINHVSFFHSDIIQLSLLIFQPHHLLGSDPSFSSASSRLRPEGDHLVLHFMGSLQREQCSHQKGQRWPTQ